MRRDRVAPRVLPPNPATADGLPAWSPWDAELADVLEATYEKRCPWCGRPISRTATTCQQHVKTERDYWKGKKK